MTEPLEDKVAKPTNDEKRIKNSGTTKAYGDNGGSTVPNAKYLNNFGSINWSKK